MSGFPHWSPQSQSALDIPPEIVHVAIQPSTSVAIARSAHGRNVGKLPPALVPRYPGVRRDHPTREEVPPNYPIRSLPITNVMRYIMRFIITSSG